MWKCAYKAILKLPTSRQVIWLNKYHFRKSNQLMTNKLEKNTTYNLQSNESKITEIADKINKCIKSRSNSSASSRISTLWRCRILNQQPIVNRRYRGEKYTQLAVELVKQSPLCSHFWFLELAHNGCLQTY